MMCDKCVSDKGEEVKDPYESDVNGVEVDVCLCPDCYQDLCMEI